MSFPAGHPIWTGIWVYFGVMGTAASVLVALILWRRLSRVRSEGGDEPGRLLTLGPVLLFASGWLMCGVAGPPGNLINPDPAIQNRLLAVLASVFSIAFAVSGWACILGGSSQKTRRER